MPSIIRKIKKFLLLPPRENRMFWEAVFWCAVARLSIHLLPFRIYSRLMGKPQQIPKEPDNNTQIEEKNRDGEIHDTKNGDENSSNLLNLISRAINRASSHVPWKTKCMVEAIAAKRMLHKRKIPCTVFLGVAKDKNQKDKLIAHAWLKCDDIIVTGNKMDYKYTVVSCFR